LRRGLKVNVGAKLNATQLKYDIFADFEPRMLFLARFNEN